MKILFSPLGMTDPIRFFKDGALLNITRHYQPDVIYLYMSKEIVKNHEKDNRYVYCLEQLGKLINKKFDIKIIKRPDLENVQIFDCFLSEFREILDEIYHNEPDAEILLNVSSGTPAMKSSLQILSLTLDYECTPIQVSTPKKSSNPHENDEATLTPDELWELNESNDEDDNRCIESQTENLLIEFKKQMVQKLILSYDYPAAYKMVENSPAFSEKFKEMLDGACARMELSYSKTRTIFRKYGESIILDKDKSVTDISEYLHLLKLKLIKKEYADFIRAITPIFANLCSMYLKNKCSVDISRYTYEVRPDFMVWKRNKLEGTDILSYLDAKYGTLKDESPVSSDSLITIIYEIAPDISVRDAVTNLRKAETGIRNSAAHAVVCITDEYIKKVCGYTSKEIFDMLKKVFNSCGYAFDEKSYDKMNDVIIENTNK